MPQNFNFNLILLAIVDPDGNRTILSRALLDADFGPVISRQNNVYGQATENIMTIPPFCEGLQIKKA